MTDKHKDDLQAFRDNAVEYINRAKEAKRWFELYRDGGELPPEAQAFIDGLSHEADNGNNGGVTTPVGSSDDTVSVPQEHEHGGKVVVGDVVKYKKYLGMTCRMKTGVITDIDEVSGAFVMVDSENDTDTVKIEDLTLIHPSPLRTKEDGNPAGSVSNDGTPNPTDQMDDRGIRQDVTQSQSATVSEEVEQPFAVGDVVIGLGACEEYGNLVVDSLLEDGFIFVIDGQGREWAFEPNFLELIHHTDIPCPGDGWERNMGVMPEGEVIEIVDTHGDQCDDQELINYQPHWDYSKPTSIAWYKPKEEADHASGCATHNEPAMEAGECDCDEADTKPDTADSQRNDHPLAEWIMQQEWEDAFNVSVKNDYVTFLAVLGQGPYHLTIEDFLNRFTPKGWERASKLENIDLTKSHEVVLNSGLLRILEPNTLRDVAIEDTLFIREHKPESKDHEQEAELEEGEDVQETQASEMATKERDGIASKAATRHANDAIHEDRKSGEEVEGASRPEHSADIAEAHGDAEPYGGETFSIADTDGVHNDVSGIGSGHEIEDPSLQIAEQIEALNGEKANV